MTKTESPATRAYWQLTDLAHNDGASDTQLFALTWLAAARMVVTEKAQDISDVDQLTDPLKWKALVTAGFPVEAYDFIVSQRPLTMASDVSRHANAATIVSELAYELGSNRWDVLPCLTEQTSRREDAAGTVVPELASLLLDMLGAPSASEVWIPFDPKGQLTVQALRRGWKVLAATPLPGWQLLRQLLLTIETGHPQPASVQTETVRDTAGRPISRSDYAIVIPPFGMQVKDGRMALWDITETRPYEQFARSETWALFEFANRVSKRAVFVAPQGVLFAKGQEQRLREYFLNRGGMHNEIQTVVALPPGVFGASLIAGAIVVLSPTGESGPIYMADLGSGRRSIVEAGDVVLAGRELALGHTHTDKARFVSHEEIRENEFSFAPSRYLSRLANLQDVVVKLGDICTIVRPPATTRESTPFEIAEIGLSDLHQWKPISNEPDKVVFLKSAPKESVLLQPGDIVLSNKGTVGRAALVGEVFERQRAIVSQSCVILRLNAQQRATLHPEVLLMYLRSPHGQALLESLQVGAGVQHISPSTLMSAVAIPLPPAEACMEIRRDFAKLCDLEHQMAAIKHQMLDISSRRWPGDFL